MIWLGLLSLALLYPAVAAHGDVMPQSPVLSQIVDDAVASAASRFAALLSQSDARHAAEMAAITLRVAALELVVAEQREQLVRAPCGPNDDGDRAESSAERSAESSAERNIRRQLVTGRTTRINSDRLDTGNKRCTSFVPRLS